MLILSEKEELERGLEDVLRGKIAGKAIRKLFK